MKKFIKLSALTVSLSLISGLCLASTNYLLFNNNQDSSIWVYFAHNNVKSNPIPGNFQDGQIAMATGEFQINDSISYNQASSEYVYSTNASQSCIEIKGNTARLFRLSPNNDTDYMTYMEVFTSSGCQNNKSEGVNVEQPTTSSPYYGGQTGLVISLNGNTNLNCTAPNSICTFNYP